MASGEGEPQEIVADIVVECRFDIGGGVEPLPHLAADLGVLALRHLLAAQAIDGAVLRRRHQPGAGIVGHAGLRPALQRRHQRILGQFLGEPDIAHHARQAGDQPRRFDPPEGVDGLVEVGGHGGRR